MRAVGAVLCSWLLVVAASQAARATEASERRMAVRLGFASAAVEPATLEGSDTFELDGDNGAEVAFEWYATRLIGVEFQWQHLRFELQSNGIDLGETQVNGLNLNLNIHIVRSRRIDFALGGTFGVLLWDDLDLTDGTRLGTRASGTLGAQATVEFNVASKWALYLGGRYQVSDLVLDETTTSGVPFSIPVDPLIGRFGATFRFGGG